MQVLSKPVHVCRDPELTSVLYIYVCSFVQQVFLTYSATCFFLHIACASLCRVRKTGRYTGEVYEMEAHV